MANGNDGQAPKKRSEKVCREKNNSDQDSEKKLFRDERSHDFQHKNLNNIFFV